MVVDPQHPPGERRHLTGVGGILTKMPGEVRHGIDQQKDDKTKDPLSETIDDDKIDQELDQELDKTKTLKTQSLQSFKKTFFKFLLAFSAYHKTS